MTVKIDEQVVGDEIHRTEKELVRELEQGTLTAARLRAAVDACLSRMGVVAPSRLTERLRAKLSTPPAPAPADWAGPPPVDCVAGGCV